MSREIVRVKDAADPNRCQGASLDGQCWNESAPGDTYCPHHGGQDKETPAEKRIYQLTKARFRNRMTEMMDHEEVKSLREEIALTRIMVEEIYNSVGDTPADMMKACGTLNGLMLTLERLIKTAHSTEQSLGMLLGKPTLILVAQQIVGLLSLELREYPDFEQTIDRVTTQMLDTIEHVTNVPEKI
jgi:hypothetical protein